MHAAELDPTWLVIGVAILVALALVVIVLRRGKAPSSEVAAPEPKKAVPAASRKEQFVRAPEAAAEPETAEVEAREPERAPEVAQEREEAREAEAEGWELEPEEEPEVEVEEAPEARPVSVVEAEPEPAGTSLREGLGKTRREGFIARLGRIFGGRTIDASVVDEIEEALFTADVGVKTVDRMMEAVREELGSGGAEAAAVWTVLRRQARDILDTAARNERATAPGPGEPRVIMVLGVNGAGKTTTIGKLAHQLAGAGTRTALVAGDTFRAAAAEQLEHWGRRVGVGVYRGEEGADPASVVFDGIKQAREDGIEVVLVDTAGRLHTQVNLMEELKKVRRVMGKALEGAPHEVLLVVDATTGQNAIQQAAMFDEACQVSGVVLTKLDGTARGGIVIGVCDQLGIPIRYIGVGERVDDLRAFEASEFVDALFAP
ncbi:MAG: signal recognition particle-docking protein FtsY [Deltaproteobacteria bacterium]|nr:signal recognition particle-docking protein FtsY [Deltaproteobacteria bacterium]MCB9786516.1 signal recognition particle-docking protein FtsY [Deltaproteobacteria bacterium]